MFFSTASFRFPLFRFCRIFCIIFLDCIVDWLKGRIVVQHCGVKRLTGFHKGLLVRVDEIHLLIVCGPLFGTVHSLDPFLPFHLVDKAETFFEYGQVLIG